MDLIFLLLTAGSFIFFLGYTLGKRAGKRLGIRESDALWPLFIRQKSLENGVCLVCGQQREAVCPTGFAGKKMPDGK